MPELFLDDAIRRAFDALPPLIPHHIDLATELRLIKRVEQEAHAIALDPQRQLQFIGRHRLVVIRAIKVGAAIDIRGAGALEQGEVLIRAHMPTALEHHVLKQVREAGPSGPLIGRTHVVPEIHRGQRQPMILRDDDFQTVAQSKALEFQPRNVAGTNL